MGIWRQRQPRRYSPPPPLAVKVHVVTEGMEFTLPDETVRALASIAVRGGLSLPDALQQAIVDENFLGQLQDDGGLLLVERRGTIRELERRPLWA